MNAVLRTWLIGTTLICGLLAAEFMWGNGISGTGTVSRFKSVVLNGVHYDTSAAAIRLNGIPGSESDLRVGHQVVIENDGVTDVALIVNQFDALRGAVESIVVNDATVAGAELHVMGQRVVTNIDTLFYDLDVETMQPGDSVAIGGVRDSSGVVLATIVEAIQANTEHVVSGPVTALDATSFRIGSITVRTPHAATFAFEGWLALGQPVMAKGTYDGGELAAATVFPINLQPVQTSDVYVERLVVEQSGQFFVDGYRLLIMSGTEFVNGSESDLAANARIEVTGELLPGQLLMTSKIEFVAATSVKVDGEIESVVPMGDSVMLTIAGVEAMLDEDVVMLDRRDHYRHYSPDDVYVSDRVSATLESTPEGYRVKSLIRRPSVHRLLRAPLQDRSRWLARLTAADHEVDDLEDADEHTLDGTHVSLFELLSNLRNGDDVEIAWDAFGRISKVRGFMRNRHQTSNDDDD